MMKNKFLALYLGFLPLLATAQNPIIQTKYTADPAPMVHNDTLFLMWDAMKRMLLPTHT